MKKLFTNYNFDFSKNEKRLISTFLKLNSNEEQVKLTKDERTRLKFQLENNLKFIQKQMSKAWFIKKWIYKSMLLQYDNLLENHFKE